MVAPPHCNERLAGEPVDDRPGLDRQGLRAIVRRRADSFPYPARARASHFARSAFSKDEGTVPDNVRTANRGAHAMRVLVAEDDALLGASVKKGLEQEGFAVDWATDGSAVDLAMRAHQYDAVTLDLGLPGISGETLLRGWRDRDDHTPVIVLTARGFVLDRVRLLDMGADDYLVKPFDLIELCARLRALIRRSGGAVGEVLECGPLQLMRHTRAVTLDGARVELTNREFWILEVLMRNKNRLMSRRQLEESLYGWGDEVESNAVEVHIHHLRRKLGHGLIQTVRGVGYQLVGPGTAEPPR
jgi:DNA-binding response OmpR family regulator